jgi:hypothetical protein
LWKRNVAEKTHETCQEQLIDGKWKKRKEKIIDEDP